MKRKPKASSLMHEQLNALYRWERQAIQYIQDDDLINRWQYLLDTANKTPLELRHTPEFQQRIAQLRAFRDELETRGYGVQQ